MPHLENNSTVQTLNLDEDISSPKTPKWIELIALISTKLLKWITWRLTQVASLPSQVAWGISKIPVVEKNLLYPQYQKYLKAHESQLPILDSIDAKIVEELEQQGICVTSLEALGIPHTAEFFNAAKKLSQELKAISLLPDNVDQYEILATSQQLMKYKELFHWGLNDRLLKIVERYLGLPVAYDGLLFVFSVADGREIGARAWHRDRECRRMIKVCVYLNDVIDGGGPFQCVQPELNSLMCSTVKHRYKSVFNEELNAFHPAASEQIKTCTGKAGTVFFVDTAKYYHRGQPPTQFNRSAVFFSYFSRRPWHPFFCQRSPFSQDQINSLTTEASTHQRACVQWKDALPWFVKLIPRSRI